MADDRQTRHIELQPFTPRSACRVPHGFATAAGVTTCSKFPHARRQAAEAAALFGHFLLPLPPLPFRCLCLIEHTIHASIPRLAVPMR